MKRFLRSFIYAVQGIRAAISEQQNLKIHFGVAIVVVAAGLYFDITGVEWCILALTIALVIGFEMMNSAIETLVDFVTRGHHPLAGKVKDIAAGAVLLVSMIAVFVGVVIFWKYVVEVLRC